MPGGQIDPAKVARLTAAHEAQILSDCRAVLMNKGWVMGYGMVRQILLSARFFHSSGMFWIILQVAASFCNYMQLHVITFTRF